MALLVSVVTSDEQPKENVLQGCGDLQNAIKVKGTLLDKYINRYIQDYLTGKLRIDGFNHRQSNIIHGDLCIDLRVR